MSTERGTYPHPYTQPAPVPACAGQYTTYYGVTGPSAWPKTISEDRIREIIREELREALKDLKP